MPELSVVIPTLGRPETLRRVLDLLGDQAAPARSFDVVVVVDAREPSPGAVRAAVGEPRLDLRLLEAERPGASAARNMGWRAAKADLILFLGDDVLPDPGLVGEHLASHRDRPAPEVGVLGRVRWARELHVTPFMRWLERGIQFDYDRITGTDAGWGRFYTANASVKRQLLDRVGGFDEDRLPFLYEDLDLAYRMSRHGLRLVYNRRAVGDHLHPADLESWRPRVEVLARSERQFVAKHPEMRPYFHDLFASAAAAPPALGRAARLAGLVPAWMPLLGPLVWRSLDMRCRQALAPTFLAAWESAERPAQAERPGAAEANSGGRSDSGPK